jgi:hypothetical protein
MEPPMSTRQVSAAPLTAGEVDRLRARLTAATLPAGDAERIDLIRSYEELKSAVAAIQVRLTAEFDASQRAGQAAVGVRAQRQARGIASQVALARKDSPARGSRHVGLARVLVREMPHTLAALSSGAISEWRATLLARETAVLSAEDRAVVDAALCSDVRRLDGLGDRRLVGEARRRTDSTRPRPYAAAAPPRVTAGSRSGRCPTPWPR